MSFNLPSPPGFQGLRDDLPLTSYSRHLPHWRQDGATYFVTFRLADSLPQSKLRELAELRRQWEQELTLSSTLQTSHDEVHQQLARRVIEQVERWLDLGMGSSLLRQPQPAKLVADAWHFFDADRYSLGAYVVMPNHVHLIVQPLSQQAMPLEKILQSRKRQTAFEINDLIGRTGSLWQEESFDRIIRDEEHLWRCLQYIGRNPRLAGLRVDECPRWIQPEWHQMGWRFEDEIQIAGRTD